MMACVTSDANQGLGIQARASKHKENNSKQTQTRNTAPQKITIILDWIDPLHGAIAGAKARQIRANSISHQNLTSLVSLR